MTALMTPRTGMQRGKMAAAATSQFLSGVGNLALRINGPGQDGRLVHIHSAKCTVGSAKGCTLRLVARGVGAMECWILRGCGGTVIRRFGGKMHLNGAHFDEALLATGDRLMMGSVEIIVEDCGSAIAGESAPALPIESSHILNLEARLDRALEQVHRLEGESRQGFESSITAADRADQLSEALAAANEQLEEVCADLTAAQATIEQQSRELAAAQDAIARHSTELTIARESYERDAQERQSAGTQLDELNARIAAAHETINRLSNELSEAKTKAAETELAHQGGAESIARLERELAASRRNRDSLTNELQKTQEAITAERMQWDREHAAAIQLREDQEHELTALREQLAAKSAELAANSVQQASNMALEAQLAELRAQLEHSQAESTLSLQRATAAETEAAKLRHSLQQQTELQTQINTQTAELTAKNQELGEARQTVDALTLQLAQVGPIDEEKTALEQQRLILTDRESQVAESIRSLEEQQAALAAEAEQLATVKNNLANLERQLNAEARQIEQAQHAILAQQAHSSESEAEIAALRQTVQEQAELQTRVDELLSELSAKTRELDEARQAVEALTSQLPPAGQIDEEKATLEQQRLLLVNRETQLAESMRSLEEKQAALLTEAEQLALVKQKLADKEQQLSEAALQIEQAQQAIISQQQRSDHVQPISETESQAAQIASRMAEVDQLLEQLVDERATLTSREQEICRRERDFDERLGELNRQAEQFQARREQLDEREAQLQERESAEVNRMTEVSLRHTTADVMQTTCHDSSRLNANTGAMQGDGSGEQLHQTMVTPPNLDGDALQSSESPDVNSALDRLASAGVWRESDESQPPTIPEPPAMPPRFVTATEDIAPAPRMMQKQGGGDDEESIESYMERLMQRVRGDSESAPTGVTQTGVAQTSVTQTRTSQSSIKPMTASVSPPTAEDVGSTMVAAMTPEGSAEGEPAPAEAMPRRPAPDLMANLSAMREVANSVAHAAINQHVRGKNRKRANRKLFGACLALGGSLVLSYVSWGASSMLGMTGAAAGCTIAMYWMFGAARGFIRLKSGKPLESDTK